MLNELIRLLYIEANTLVNSKIGRPALVARFSISKETATRSLAFYEENCPGQTFIDKGLKKPAYVATDKCKPCLFKNMDEARQFLDANHQIDGITDYKLKKMNMY